VQVDVEARAAREDERAQGSEVLLAAVHLGLEEVDLGLRDAGLLRVHILRERREDRAEVEELVLDPVERAPELPEPRGARLRR
jgi:RNA-binding protein YhbY